MTAVIVCLGLIVGTAMKMLARKAVVHKVDAEEGSTGTTDADFEYALRAGDFTISILRIICILCRAKPG